MTQTYFDGDTVGFASEFEFQPKVVRVKTLNVETNFFNKSSVRYLGWVTCSKDYYFGLYVCKLQSALKFLSNEKQWEWDSRSNTKNFFHQKFLEHLSSLLSSWSYCHTLSRALNKSIRRAARFLTTITIPTTPSSQIKR